MNKYQELLNNLTVLSNKYDLSVKLELELKNGELTFDAKDIKITLTDADKIDAIINDLSYAIIDPEELSVFVTLIHSNNDRTKVIAMIANWIERV